MFIIKIGSDVEEAFWQFVLNTLKLLRLPILRRFIYKHTYHTTIDILLYQSILKQTHKPWFSFPSHSHMGKALAVVATSIIHELPFIFYAVHSYRFLLKLSPTLSNYAECILSPFYR